MDTGRLILVSWLFELMMILFYQGGMWAAISRLMTVVAVAGKRQGKTLGWLLPLLNLLEDSFNYDHLPPGKQLQQ